uniref:Elongation of very long chain fatty acids protein n=1 Tax=Brachionus koreanus TaxID=1199090 RepID=A0A291LM87_9BILA|nr:elongase 3 [Brachionus koreanus]QBO55914.1 elongation of very long chain fatty acid 9d [Brachionus koreanus]
MLEQNMSLVEIYQYYLNQGDPRVRNWMLMTTPIKTILYMIAYLISIPLIKKYMEKREPFKLKGFLIFYNFFQVIGSFYIFSELLIVSYKSNYSYVCQTVDYSEDPLAMRMVSVLWFYYISKLIDFVDTICFALRKKTNQITILHVFHHLTMFPYGWIGLKYVGGGQTFFLCMLNSFVHTVMYAYYGLSALGPSVQKYLWWKRYITQLQLLQFFAVMTHSIINVYVECAFPKAFSLSYLIYGMIITGFFINFYVQSYIKRMGLHEKSALKGESDKQK